MTYATRDDLPDLTPAYKTAADSRPLAFTAYSEAGTSWDYRAQVSGTNLNAPAQYTFTGIAGAVYDIVAVSYFDFASPLLTVIVYDSYGNAIAGGDETIDPPDVHRPDGYDYAQDVLADWVAPYSGTYYVNANWAQGDGVVSYYSLSLYENRDIGGGTIFGTAGNDSLKGTPGNDTINGLGGTDSVLFFNQLSDVSVLNLGAYYRVDTPQGTETLTNVERLVFADKNVNLTIQALAAATPAATLDRIEELYVAFFNRVPEADGLAFWVQQANQGMSINAIADAFYAAGTLYPSTTGFYPNSTNGDFVDTVYRNVLGREEADAEGLNFWTQELDSGRATKGSLVTAILDSAHTFKGNPTWGWVANLLDNKLYVANTFAVEFGLGYNTPTESIGHGIEIAAAVTPYDTIAALVLIGEINMSLVYD